MYIYGVYTSPNCTEVRYEEFLRDLQEDTTGRGDSILVGGDFNAKPPLWGSPIKDRNGKILSEWAASSNI